MAIIVHWKSWNFPAAKMQRNSLSRDNWSDSPSEVCFFVTSFSSCNETDSSIGQCFNLPQRNGFSDWNNCGTNLYGSVSNTPRVITVSSHFFVIGREALSAISTLPLTSGIICRNAGMDSIRSKTTAYSFGSLYFLFFVWLYVCNKYAQSRPP